MPHISFPQGFSALTAELGLRDAGADFALVVSDRPASAAGVFTRSLFTGPSVTLSRDHLTDGRARAVAVVAKNANVANGDSGLRDAEDLCRAAAAIGGIDEGDVVVASTGVIGRPYPMETMGPRLAGLRGACFGASPLDVARAMMTTDTVPKTAYRAVGQATVVGVAKGVGMIEPDMATMLAFVFTDAEVAPAALERMWRRAVDPTFNCLSVDSDTSTSDSAVVLANGAVGPVPEPDLGAALREVCLDLTLQLARDGEGATKLLTVTVRSARDAGQARRVAKAIVNSPLVKTAVHGADPNWGRVAMAIGKCREDTDIDPGRVVIRFADVEAYPQRPGPEGLAELTRAMSADHVDIDVELGTGPAEATVWGCDLGADYVRINADYTT